MSLIPVSERYAFPIYKSLDDYQGRTGLIAPWDPTMPPRYWESRSKGQQQYMTPPPSKGVGPGFVVLDASFVNIPHEPKVMPWTPPAVVVTQNGVQLGDQIFSTRDEAEQIMKEINASVIGKGVGVPIVFGLTEYNSAAFPYKYGPFETRRCWEFSDGKLTYNAGERIAHRNRKGASIITAGWVGNRATNVIGPCGKWTYGKDGWFLDLDLSLQHDTWTTTREGIPPAILLNPGETLMWIPSALPGEDTLMVRTVDDNTSTNAQPEAPLSAWQKEVLDRLKNVETMVKSATSGR